MLPPSPLTSHFFICHEKFKNLKTVMPHQTILLGRIVKDTWFFSFNAWSCGWATKVKAKWQCDWICLSCLELTLDCWHSPPRFMYYTHCVRPTFLLKHTIAWQIPVISWILLFSAVFICQPLFHYWYFQLLCFLP